MTERQIQLRDKIMKGLDLASKRLIEQKAKRNEKLVVSVNGKVTYIDPKTLLPASKVN